MMKFRFRRQGTDPQREKIKQELFAFNKTVEHGFPHQPSALAFDPKLQLMAIGTKSGAIKMYPFPTPKDEPPLRQSLFLKIGAPAGGCSPSFCAVLCVCNDGFLCLTMTLRSTDIRGNSDARSTAVCLLSTGEDGVLLCLRQASALLRKQPDRRSVERSILQRSHDSLCESSLLALLSKVFGFALFVKALRGI
ncbi:unnamed protein product [Tetraodon nigroviridis]|uniref:(spotted green pufferfish) hypothetical protein n=1 Tax=Tetraodon nigroviridis TaxID=99883 RepID=Q4S9X5_TETNG|nr:unnamed protein product [Tetraodon nigroviridis]